MWISYTSAFHRAYRKLVRSQPSLADSVDDAIRHLAEDPSHPGLHVHPVRSWPGCREARVTASVRIIFTQQGDDLVLVLVGRHDILP